MAGRPVSRPRSVLATYGLSAAALAGAVLLRYLLDPWLGDSLALVTLFGAVAFAVWIGGPGPAALVAILGYLACDYLFIPPRGSFSVGGFGGVLGFLAYLFTCALIAVFGESARRAHAQALERRELLRVTLFSIGDAVITTDVDARVTSMNGIAETLTGWTQLEAIGEPLDDVFRIVNEETREPVPNPATRALRQGIVVGLANHTVLIRKDGEEFPIDDSAAPIRNEHGAVSGCVLIFRDVSNQRRVQQERTRQLSAARLLASIIESSDDAIISKSLDGVIQSWNAGAERIFGYAASQAVGRHISLIIPAERLAEEDHIIASLKAGTRIEHFETERQRADGSRILVSLTISPVRGESGTVVGASKIVRDVTRQRQAEQRERRLLADAVSANAKFHAFFEQGAMLAGILDANGTVIEVNRGSLDALGYPKEQVIGRPFWEGPWWASEELKTRLAQACSRAARGEVFRGEVPYVTASGEPRVSDVSLQSITDDRGDILFVACTGVDITDRKRAEADREKFVALVESSTDFIGLCDTAGMPFFVNRAGLALVGLDSIDAACRTPVRSFFFPEDQDRIMNQFLPGVLERGHGEVEVRFRHFKTGEARWMAYKVIVLPDASGRPIGFATVSQDITERKRLEDDLRSLASELSEAGRRKDEFLAMLAHELRNPLAAISNATQALRLGDAASLRTASSVLERQVTQLSRLVDDLLDVSRISRGKIDLRLVPTALAPIVQQAVDATRPYCGAMKHELTVTMPSDTIVVEADAARLAQVVGNLLHNACKFTNPGGHISLTAGREGNDAVIRVRDDGIGIAPEHLPFLFDMFAQVDTSLERAHDGLGIGLTLVKTLIELHGGSVSVSSAGRGQGSEFTLRLPVADTARQTAAPPTDAPAAAVTPRRILIVDDNEDAAASLSLLLQFGGHQTQMVHDGEAALEAAERFRPEVMLLDIGLPGMNGYEVCRRIRRESWGRAITIVALTGWGQVEDRRRSREAGFDTHMVKPVEYAALAKLLASVPENASAGRDVDSRESSPSPAPDGGVR
jgi:PAS domain S-box-containing protein